MQSEREGVIPVGAIELAATAATPPDAVGVVAFVHGSGSSRLSPRNRRVARALNDAGLATLLFDLLTPDEDRDRRFVFDIDLLSDRLRAATRWVREQPALAGLSLGLFGASTGAAAALRVAADPDSEVRAVVSRGGRPDLAGASLRLVTCPTLLIVGGQDPQVLDLNRQALELLSVHGELVVVPGATHLFEEPGALEQVSRLACDWFLRQLGVIRP